MGAVRTKGSRRYGTCRRANDKGVQPVLCEDARRQREDRQSGARDVGIERQNHFSIKCIVRCMAWPYVLPRERYPAPRPPVRSRDPACAQQSITGAEHPWTLGQCLVDADAGPGYPAGISHEWTSACFRRCGSARHRAQPCDARAVWLVQAGQGSSWKCCAAPRPPVRSRDPACAQQSITGAEHPWTLGQCLVDADAGPGYPAGISHEWTSACFRRCGSARHRAQPCDARAVWLVQAGQGSSWKCCAAPRPPVRSRDPACAQQSITGAEHPWTLGQCLVDADAGPGYPAGISHEWTSACFRRCGSARHRAQPCDARAVWLVQAGQGSSWKCCAAPRPPVRSRDPACAQQSITGAEHPWTLGQCLVDADAGPGYPRWHLA